MATTKRIFVSDLHMGDERSLHPPDSLHPYGWLGEQRAALFAEFLQTRVLNDPDATELVILGDLFDVWVCPASIDPCHNGPRIEDYFQAIAAAAQNKGILDKLRTIANASKLTYVNGNHDMQFTEAIAKTIIPNVRYQEQEIYDNQTDGIHAEHGHHYTLFNAKDHYTSPARTDHILPIGYFISRIAAQYQAKTGKDTPGIWRILLNILLKAFEAHAGNPYALGIGSALISECYSDAEIYYGYDQEISMNGYDQFANFLIPPQIKSFYQVVDSRWSNLFPPWEAFLHDIGSQFPDCGNLRHTARKVASVCGQRLIIFGHTHHAELDLVNAACVPPALSPIDQAHGITPEVIEQYLKECETRFPPVAAAEGVLYANTGTWVDGVTQCTALETWQMGEALWVTLYEYLGKGQRRVLTRFVRPASAAAFQPITGHYLPLGSYITTSQQIRFTVSATCEDPKGHQYEQTLELTAFDGAVDIINDNGTLRLGNQPINPNDLERIHDAKQRLNCGRYVPDGTYLFSSSNVQVTLSATCQRINPNEWKDSTITLTSFTTEVLIENDDGDLHVSEKGGQTV